jgi:hypothetical protein
MKNFRLWLLAFVIAAGTLFYQEMTGPTYPFRAKVTVDGTAIKFELPRTSEDVRDCEVSIRVPDPAISGFLEYRRFPTDEEWNKRPLERTESQLMAYLPKQPPAGKLAYKIVLNKGENSVSLSGEKPVIIRFRGVVPVWVLIPHVLFMLLAMLFAARAGFEALRKDSNPQNLARWAALFFFASGFIIGPLMQYYGFNNLWTGFPLGHDLTDTKTLVAMIGWIAALVAGRRGKPARGWILAAAVLQFATFLIPHSLFGSELSYSKTPPAGK